MSKNKKIILIILSIFIVLSLFLGISYAYYIKSINQEESNVVKTKCLNVSLTNEKNDINLDEQYPIPDTEGRKLTPYQFTITNTCEQFISYSVNLEALEGTTMDSNAIKVMVNNEAPANLATLDTAQTSIDNSVESRTLVTGSLGSGDSIDYALRLWMDYGDSADLSNMNKVFNSKVVVTATLGTYKPIDYVSTLHDALLINEYAVTDVNNAISRIEAKETPDFSKTAPIIEWQEKHETSVLKYETSLPHPSLIGNEELGGKKLTEDDSKFYLSTSYTFDPITGNYSLVGGRNYSYDEVENLDKNKDYYFCQNYTLIDESNNQFYTGKAIECKKLKKLTDITASVSGTPNTRNYVIKYSANYIEYSQIELENDKSDRGLYQAEDDYGSSYYYRGNISNNNVYFGGYYWQIIRLNGDGSIRLMYNGNIKNASGVDQSIGLSEFNPWNNPAYVGYMYGNNIGTRENNIKNENNSIVKTLIDDWYKTNLLEAYDSYIDDAGFCGDRSIYTGDGFSTDNWTNFASEYRLRYNSTKSPTLKCPDVENDFYTINSASIGNKALNYPVGLITADELAFAGMVNELTNLHGWAYNNYNYYTMTPKLFYSTGMAPYVWVMDGNDDNFGEWRIGSNISVRPVINLKSDVEITGGIGTINDPFVIKTT